MIRYALQCDTGHSFESWFANGAAYDGLAAAGQLTCPYCGSTKIAKALMVPSLRAAGGATAPTGAEAAPSAQALPAQAEHAPPRGQAGPGQTADGMAAAGAMGAAPGTPAKAGRAELEAALAAIRHQVESNSEYVGLNFAAEARRIHLGEAPERAIYGEARPDEARRLIEEGVPVAPLPFLPRRKTN